MSTWGITQTVEPTSAPKQQMSCLQTLSEGWEGFGRMLVPDQKEGPVWQKQEESNGMPTRWHGLVITHDRTQTEPIGWNPHAHGLDPSHATPMLGSGKHQGTLHHDITRFHFPSIFFLPGNEVPMDSCMWFWLFGTVWSSHPVYKEAVLQVDSPNSIQLSHPLLVLPSLSHLLWTVKSSLWWLLTAFLYIFFHLPFQFIWFWFK